MFAHIQRRKVSAGNHLLNQAVVAASAENLLVTVANPDIKNRPAVCSKYPGISLLVVTGSGSEVDAAL